MKKLLIALVLGTLLAIPSILHAEEVEIKLSVVLEMESIVNKEDDQYIFFPAYNQDGVVALYLYTGLSQFGASEYISDINVLSDLHAESSCFNNIIIDISCGTYSVEPTTSSDVYVISFL